MARRRSSIASFDDRWDGRAELALEAIDLDGASATRAAPPARPPGAYRRSRRRAWVFAVASVASTAVVAYAIVNHRAAASIADAWTAATTDADALADVIEGLRTTAMQADVTGEDPADFAAARQGSVRQMRARLAVQRDELASAFTFDPKLLSLKRRALDGLDAWAAEMDAFLDRNGLWLRRPEFGQLDAPMDEAVARWRLDVDEPRPVELAGHRFLARLSTPSDEPLPFILTALTSSGHRLDVDLLSQETVRTELDDENRGLVPLGAIAANLRIEGDRIIVTTPGLTFARLPVEPSPEVELVVVQPRDEEPGEEHLPPDRMPLPPELRDVELADGRFPSAVAVDAATGRVAFAHTSSRQSGPDVVTTLSVVEPDGRTVRDIVTVPHFVNGIAISGDWIVFGRSGSVRMSLRAVDIRTGRFMTIRLPDPYITAFVVRPSS